MRYNKLIGQYLCSYVLGRQVGIFEFMKGGMGLRMRMRLGGKGGRMG